MGLSLNLIYNHRYEGNICRLTEAYGHRFSHVNHLIPFAKSKDPNVVRVSENGIYFSSHIAQASDRIVADGVSHYVFAGDDLLLNPGLNESNLLDVCRIGQDEAYIKSLANLDDAYYLWTYLTQVVSLLRKPNFSYEAELPEPSTARDKYARLGIEKSRSRLHGLLHWNGDIGMSLKDMLRHPGFVMEAAQAALRHEPKYPFLFGYSDFFVVPARYFENFAHFCAVFGALNVYAEVAIPTALALACDSVQTEYIVGEVFAGCKPPKPNPDRKWHGSELWGTQIADFEQRYELDLRRLLEQFPQDCIYIHPVKLSRWK